MNLRLHGPRRYRRAFTLIEVLLVLGILIVVSSFVVVNFVSVGDEANKKAAKTQIASVSNLINVYRLNVGQLPTSLEALHSQPSDVDASKWSAVMDKAVPPDPWGHPYEYKVVGNKFELRSIGPDGQSNTADDITN